VRDVLHLQLPQLVRLVPEEVAQPPVHLEEPPVGEIVAMPAPAFSKIDRKRSSLVRSASSELRRTARSEMSWSMTIVSSMRPSGERIGIAVA